MDQLRARTLAVMTTLATVWAAASCSNGVPLGPTTTTVRSTIETGTTPTPTAAPTPTPTPTPTIAAIAYTPDIQPILDADCTPCHGGRSPKARYSTASYANVMAGVRAGSASSALVIVTQPGGSMYGFLTGDRAGKSALISRWVLSGAPVSR